MQLTTCLWFEHGQAREAAEYYTSTFPGGKLDGNWVTPEATPGNEANSEVTVEFEICGQKFLALNGGPYFAFNEAISFVIPCASQDEVDHYWDKIIGDGGQAGQCGWLKDKYGVSWQVVPTEMYQYLGGSDGEGSQRAVQAMLQMQKLVVADLKAAYENA